MYYKNDFGNIFGGTFTTPVGRLQFVTLVQAKEFRGKAKYGATLLFDKATQDTWLPGFALIQNDIEQMIAQEYPNGAPAFKYGMLRDGDEEKYNGFAGRFYIKTSANINDARVAVYDAAGKTIDPSLPVAGMLARAVVRVGLFDNGVSYKLIAIQLIKDDGVRFTGAPDTLSFLTETPVLGYEGNDTFVAPAISEAAAQVSAPSKVAVAPIAAKTGAVSAAKPTVAPVIPQAQAQVAQRVNAASQGFPAGVAASTLPKAAPRANAIPAMAKPAGMVAPTAPAGAKPTPSRGLANVRDLNKVV